MEVAATWDRLLPMYKAVKAAIGREAFVMAHFSHAYAEGCSIYFTFVSGLTIGYGDLEPFYGRAEALYRVRGDASADPTEPPHSAAYPFPPVPDESDIATLRRALVGQGLHVASLPLGIDLDRWLARAPTTWDAFPDTTGAKSDAESCGLATALRLSLIHI